MRIYRNPYVLLAQAREDAMAERARLACDPCAPTSSLATGTPRVPAHERPTCCPWYSEHEWCAAWEPS